MKHLIVYGDYSNMILNEALWVFIRKTMDDLTAKLGFVEIIMEGGIYVSALNGAIETWSAQKGYTIRCHFTRPEDPLTRGADRAVVFWNGKDENTKKMIQLFRKKVKKVKIIRYEHLLTENSPQKKEKQHEDRGRRGQRIRRKDRAPKDGKADQIPF